MYKSYQPVHPCGNKLLQKRWDDSTFSSHRQRVYHAQPMVDTKTPKEHPHVRSKLKKQQLTRERSYVVDRDNLHLLTKMQHTMEVGNAGEFKNAYTHHSLNSAQRQREIDRLSEENRTLLVRLQKVQPHYKANDWLMDWHRHHQKVEMITAYPDKLHTYPGHGPSRTTSRNARKSIVNRSGSLLTGGSPSHHRSSLSSGSVRVEKTTAKQQEPGKVAQSTHSPSSESERVEQSEEHQLKEEEAKEQSEVVEE